jgi:hypothetical protein
MNSEVYSLPEIKREKRVKLHVPLKAVLKNNEIISDDVLKLSTQI